MLYTDIFNIRKMYELLLYNISHCNRGLEYSMHRNSFSYLYYKVSKF